MTAATSPTRLALAALVSALLAGTGCTEFVPIEGAADGSEDTSAPDGTDASGGEIRDGDADDGDTLPDAPELPDGDTAADEITPDDADGDAAEIGPPDVAEVDAPTCEDACPEAGAGRCVSVSAVDDVERAEICAVSSATGCLTWQLHRRCDQGDLCQGFEACVEGECIRDPDDEVTCGDTDHPCTKEECNPETGDCEVEPAVNADCDDGDVCTVSRCGSDGECSKIVPDTAGCPCEEDADCIEFDDGDLCDGRYRCSNKVCSYDPTPTTCDGEEAPTCHTLACDPDDGECKAQTVPNFTGCDDENLCTVSSTCQAGNCVGSEFVDCSGQAGLCEAGSCDPETGSCTFEPIAECCGDGIPEGAEQCDDGNAEAGDGCEPDCTLTPCDTLAMRFDEGCILIPGSDLSNFMSNSTIEFFIRPAAVSQEVVLLDRERAANPGVVDWHLALTSSGGAAGLTWVEGRLGGDDEVVPGPVLEFDTWQHVALVRSLPDDEVSWWLDGELYAAEPVSGLNDLGSNEELWVGCQDGDAEASFQGDLDELRISTNIRYFSPFEPPVAPHGDDGSTSLLMHFDDIQPGVAVDATGQGNHGYWQGARATTDDPFGAAGGASCPAEHCFRASLRFDPAMEPLAVVEDASGLDGVQTLSVEFYLRPNDVSSTQVLLSRASGVEGAADWHVELRSGSGGKGRLVWVEDLADTTVSSPSALEAGQWVHALVVRDHSDPEAPTIRWFLDGQAAPPKASTGAPELVTNAPLLIGSRNGAAPFFDGVLDELRITEGVVHEESFSPPSTVAARSDTLAVYHFDLGRGSWAYSDIPSVLPPMRLDGTIWSPARPPSLTPCPQ